MNGDNNIKKTKSVITVKQLDMGVKTAKVSGDAYDHH